MSKPLYPVELLGDLVLAGAAEPTVSEKGLGPAHEEEVGNVLDRLGEGLWLGVAPAGRKCVVEHTGLRGAVRGAELAERRRARASLRHERPGAAPADVNRS